MTQVWQGDKVSAVTRVQAGPCLVVQVKTNKGDGYQAVQIGFSKRKEKNIKKPQRGHMKGLGNFRYLREFRISPINAKERQDEIGLKRGDKIDVSIFETGDNVKVTGISKGKGFQGVVKRHGFHGAPKSHGTKDQLRMPGSIGATGPAHVFKGKKMPGQMGGDKVTVANLEIIEVDRDNNVLLIKGAVPGARNGLVLIEGKGELKLKVKSDLSADKAGKLKEEDKQKEVESKKVNKVEGKESDKSESKK